MKDLKIEFRKFTNDDFSKTPKCFKQDYPELESRLIRHDNCGMILRENDRPHYYFHNMNEFSSRWSGFIRLGDGPLSLQEGVENTDTAQTDQLSTYGKVSDDPITYGVKTLSGINMEFTYNEDGCCLVEGENGSILDVKGEWFPFGLICHLGSEYNILFQHLPVHLKGTYQNKPVEFLACIDRIFLACG